MEKPNYPTAWEFVTPELARKYLGANSYNRNLIHQWVKRAVELVHKGLWHTTHQGIAFRADGQVGDGQHRLWLIVESNQGMWLLVTRGMPPEAFLGVDCGRARRPQDVAKIAGMGDILTCNVATAWAMYHGTLHSTCRTRPIMSNEQVLKFMADHSEPIAFVHATLCGKAKYGNAVVRGALARAWYYIDPPVLTRFAEVLTTAQAQNPGESAAIMLGRYVDSHVNEMNGGQMRMALARHAEAAIRAFADHRPIKSLRAVSKELFPLDGEATVETKPE